MKTEPSYHQFGDHAILIRWAKAINELTNEEVLQLDEFISEKFKKEIIESVPAFHSLAVYLKEGVSVSEFIEKVRATPLVDQRRIPRTKSIITIPVCYEDRYALDIEHIAKFHNLSSTEVIKIHTDSIYKVYFLGFLPGFPYLGGLDERLVTPRKSTPRNFIARGSVAIGGSQSGIYTLDSPGGWNIIGKSPLRFFSSEGSSLSLLHAGDFLRFKSVTRKTYKKIRDEVRGNTYKVEREVHHG